MQSSSIVFVDDNESDQFLFEHTLHNYDNSISLFKAYDGLEAITLLVQEVQNPDLIFLDVNMPGMNGFEFIEHYHRNSLAHSSIILMSCDCSEREKQKLFEDYRCLKAIIEKPITEDHLKKLL